MAKELNKPANTSRQFTTDGYPGSLERGYQPGVKGPIPHPPQVGTTTVIPVAPSPAAAPAIGNSVQGTDKKD